MTITPYLDGQHFNSETKRILGLAFEMTRGALKLEDRNGPIVAIIAKKIIELAKCGERDANSLCERTLADLKKGPEPPPTPTEPPPAPTVGP
jgi:hypothetical protein